MLSLYIPIVQKPFSEAYISKMFKVHQLGDVLRVDFVRNKEKDRVEAFVHFRKWFDTENARVMQLDVQNPNTKTRFVYTESGKFWPLLVNKNAEKRGDNPKYAVIAPTEVKSTFKAEVDSLDLWPRIQTRSQTQTNQPKEPDTKKSKSTQTETTPVPPPIMLPPSPPPTNMNTEPPAPPPSPTPEQDEEPTPPTRPSSPRPSSPRPSSPVSAIYAF